MKEQSLNTFELYWSNYKKYQTFYENYEKNQLEGMKEQIEHLMESANTEEEAIKFIFNVKAYPNMYARDINTLKEQLLVAYDFVQDLPEISPETKTEMAELIKKRDKPLFIIEGDKATEVDTDRIEYYKKTFSDKSFINQAMQLAKNIIKADK